MRVLIACEFSGVVREAFRRRGHDAWSCDLEPDADNDPAHLQCDVMKLLEPGAWDLMIAHPPCTYIARSGWHWVNAPDSRDIPLKGLPRMKAAIESAAFFRSLLAAKIPKIAIENPRPICHVNIPPSSQVVQPWMFGDGEVKETHLWLKNLPPLEPTNQVDGRLARVHHESPGIVNGLTRQQRRSITYPGLAEAMADQWTAAI